MVVGLVLERSSRPWWQKQRFRERKLVREERERNLILVGGNGREGEDEEEEEVGDDVVCDCGVARNCIKNNYWTKNK